MGFCLNPGVGLATPRSLSSNRIEGVACENLRNVADTAELDSECSCQQNCYSELGQKGSGSPDVIRTLVNGSKKQFGCIDFVDCGGLAAATAAVSVVGSLAIRFC